MTARTITLALSVALTVGSAGCGSRSKQQCMPAPLAVSANPSARSDDGEYLVTYIGGTVTVSAPGVACDPRDSTTAYQILFSGSATPPETQPTVLQMLTVPVRPDGSFRATLNIPTTAQPGGASLYVHGSNLTGECDDQSECASYSSTLLIKQTREHGNEVPPLPG